jgi:hypothetical protein
MAISCVSSPGRPADVTPACDNLTTISRDARSAYRISRFATCPDAVEPIRWRFCLQPTESVAKRVLFSLNAATAKVRGGPEKQNFKAYFIYYFQIVN